MKLIVAAFLSIGLSGCSLFGTSTPGAPAARPVDAAPAPAALAGPVTAGLPAAPEAR